MAGIAGLIIGIGTTADSFVVFFERIKDDTVRHRAPGGHAVLLHRWQGLGTAADRINELDRRLRTGPTPWSGSETLPGGTEVTLRFPDGEVV
ncbi:hypothetical protein ACNJQJ_21925, partial [Mycobacterium tuberculosis]